MHKFWSREDFCSKLLARYSSRCSRSVSVIGNMLTASNCLVECLQKCVCAPFQEHEFLKLWKISSAEEKKKAKVAQKLTLHDNLTKRQLIVRYIFSLRTGETFTSKILFKKLYRSLNISEIFTFFFFIF